MATDLIRYDVLARDALRGVLRRVLTDAAEQGLPGEHHFFITFLSKADGVKISPRLLAQYPEEMTIILQHQFWDLTVTDDRFELIAPHELALVTFRLRAGDDATRAVMDDVNASGELYLTHTVVDGRVALRMAIGATLTEARHVEAAWGRLQEAASRAG